MDPIDKKRDPLLHVNNMIDENYKLKYYFSLMCPNEFAKYTTFKYGNCLEKRSDNNNNNSKSKSKNTKDQSEGNPKERMGDIDFCVEQSVSLYNEKFERTWS